MSEPLSYPALSKLSQYCNGECGAWEPGCMGPGWDGEAVSSTTRILGKSVAIVGVLVRAGDGGVGDSNDMKLFCLFVNTHNYARAVLDPL